MTLIHTEIGPYAKYAGRLKTREMEMNNIARVRIGLNVAPDRRCWGKFEQVNIWL